MDLKKAAIINAGSKFFIIVTQLITTGILGRILSPMDYGIVAVIAVFFYFFTGISDVGLISAVIQHKELSKKDCSHIFSVTVYLGIILGGLFIGISRILVIVYESKVYWYLGLLLSISVLFSSMNAVPGAILMREKRFLLSAFRNILTSVIAGIIAIIMALNGFRFYSVIVQMIVGAVLTFTFNALVSKVGFTPFPDLKPVRKLLRFSTFQVLYDAVFFLSQNMDNLLAGRIFGKEKLGYYNKAYSLTQYPVNNISGVVSPVLHPILSDYQSDTEALYQKIMPVVRVLGILGAFIAPFCFFEGREMILIVFGKQWTESVVCFRVFAFSIYAQMLNQCISAGFQSIGKTNLLFINEVINTGIMLTAILIGIFAFEDIFGLALCVSVAYIIRFFIAYYILIRFGFRRSYFLFLREISPEIIMLFVMNGVALFIPVSVDNLYLSFVIKGGIMVGLYALLLFSSGDWKLIRDAVFSSKRD